MFSLRFTMTCAATYLYLDFIQWGLSYNFDAG